MDPVNAVSIWVDETMILIFKDETEFREVLKANEHLVPLYGMRDIDRLSFPGLYIAQVCQKPRG